MLRKLVKNLIFILAAHAALFGDVADQVNHWNGDLYEQNCSLQYKWAIESLKRFEFRGDRSILDVGCGDGRITAAIAKFFPDARVIGTDFSDSMIAKANANKDKDGPKNLSYEIKNAMELDYKQEFDLVISFSCLHWVPDHLATLKGIEKALMPGGRAFLYFALDHGRNRFDRSMYCAIQSPQWRDYFHDFASPFTIARPHKFLKDVEEANMLLKKMEMITYDEVYESREAFMKWMRGWLPHLERLPSDKHQAFLEDVVDFYLEKCPVDANGHIHYIDYFIEVEVLKGPTNYLNPL